MCNSKLCDTPSWDALRHRNALKQTSRLYASITRDSESFEALRGLDASQSEASKRNCFKSRRCIQLQYQICQFIQCLMFGVSFPNDNDIVDVTSGDTFDPLQTSLPPLNGMIVYAFICPSQSDLWYVIVTQMGFRWSLSLSHVIVQSLNSKMTTLNFNEFDHHQKRKLMHQIFTVYKIFILNRHCL